MYLDTGNKTECFGCEGCVQICGVKAISMKEDEEGFRYPVINLDKCVHCNLCRKVCPYEHMPPKDSCEKYAFGGYNKDQQIRFESTSGGAFSAIVDAFCDENYVIFGAEAKGLTVFHSGITDKGEIEKFRKSKYSQSAMGYTYKQVKEFLREGKKVLFSGTPCQTAGLLSFLGDTNRDKLLTIEVICEGIPSSLYIRKMEKDFEKKFGRKIESIDYRYTGRNFFSHCDRMIHKGNDYARKGGKWDFQQMQIGLTGGGKKITKDRWFNPFWSVWLQHLMSRPSCYGCPFTTSGRVADISLGDLWGVHLYCPELYGKNGGASLVVCNTEKGKEVFASAQGRMFGHELKFEDALKYQSPMRKPISSNENREAFISDLQSNMDFKALNKKWAKPATLKLLYQKYIWGNRQKIFFWNMTHNGRKS